ncbi:MAG: helix-turn-helix domain-containing protein [Planctomycetaceae bacterium]|jgi:CRP/FNR family transcriptional regulator|nr:helix-turn-helix domain-containing protein [Planctomycetaceae bacterium]MBT5508632.1 helix-turn-helix domain-containing protein [Euryarchaeota archaeon]MBT7671313.1 helix-turn-helix domain-containing protein [Pseudomonadota bacterium]
MGSSQVLAVTAMQSNCGDCKRASSCIGLGVSKENIAKAVNLTARKQLLHKADRLFSAGDQINNLYLVHSGVLKTYRITPEGDRQVIGFYFADQIINLDSLYDGKSTVFAEALNTASVCAVSIAEFKNALSLSPELQDGFVRRMSKMIRQQTDHTVSVGICDATQRMARTLYRISKHYRTMGYSQLCFELPMSRVDIASYLGLAIETVSRQIRKLCELGIVKITRNKVEILAMDKLMICALVDEQATEFREVA